jgi:hypothetical protein
MARVEVINGPERRLVGTVFEASDLIGRYHDAGVELLIPIDGTTRRPVNFSSRMSCLTLPDGKATSAHETTAFGAQLPVRLFPQNPSQPARRDYARCGAGTAGHRRRKVSRHRM